MKKKATVIKHSKDSLAIIIPKIFCDLLVIEKGQKLEFEIKNLKSDEIILRKVKEEEIK